MTYVRREVTIEVPPEEVWEALATEAGRERWLEPDPDRELLVETEQAPDRIVWWWWREDEAPRRVELLVVAAPAGSRVIVIESAPELPLARLQATLSLLAV